MTTNSILKVKGLTKSYFTTEEEFKILKGLDFEVKPGEFLSIMGPSGSGKSTLMHILGGLDQPTTGSYFLNGKELSSLDDDNLSKVRNQEIGFIFQAFFLIPQNTVLENVLLPSRYSGNKKIQEEKAKELLKRIGLGDRIYFRPNQLSGGQCQRVAIARALFNNPSIIMADEPTGNLDTATGNEIMAILQYLNSLGKTIIMVTHERDIALHTNKILHLRDGQIEKFEGVKESLKAESGSKIDFGDIFNE